MKTLISIILALGCFLTMSACKKQHEASPWVGLWKLDVNKSRLNERPKQETMQIVAADQAAVKFAVRGISDEGKPYSEDYDGKPDGNAYPVTADGKELGKIAFHWQSAHVYTADGKGTGGTTLTETATLSHDGTTITIKSREGKDEEETAIFTK